jgi:oligopeptide transport system ATP-binding protein
LTAIGGLPPNLLQVPAGCPFHPRCRWAQPACREGQPPALAEVGERHRAACHFWPEVAAAASGLGGGEAVR